ncbi:MAG: polyketide synthase, partial [bacterium]|nr:polyketide synthase [bacterium]
MDDPRPVAVVGLGCRLPGAENVADYWRLLEDGRDAITEIPPERWDADGFYDPDPEAHHRMSSRWGGFITDIDEFDADFFGISPQEASTMDPQQRILMQLTWEALEHAAIAPPSLRGSRTGLYLGASNWDYSHLLMAEPGGV